ncbi:hypothetical protein P7C70_g7447, partial [Phenoliferia sp. Uapishka_3]
MDSDKAEKGSSNSDNAYEIHTSSVPAKQLYDPSKESIWTRAGLSWESYKRAPGATGGQRVSGTAGSDGLAEGENPMLQQQTVVILFVILGAVLNAGGGPSGGAFNTYVGGKNWVDPGGFANGFKGVCAVFVTAAFSFAGTELVGLAATETPDPRATMPGAVKGTFWRITLIYLSSLLIITLNVPYNDPSLLNGSGTGTSPFVLMVTAAGIKGLDHLINITICISGESTFPSHMKTLSSLWLSGVATVLSIGLSCVYAGSRVLTALSEQGYAPKIFSYVDKSGRPLFSVLAILAWGPLAYVNVTPSGGAIFDWLLAISGLSTLFTWGAICLCHIRFRAAWKAQGHSVEELPFKAMGGVWGSWFGIVLVVLVLISQFYIAVWPIGGMDPDGLKAAEAFFKAYLAAPVMLAFWVRHLPFSSLPSAVQSTNPQNSLTQLAAFIWKRTWPLKASEIDLDTGRKSWLTVEEMRIYRAERRCAPWHVRIYRILFSN